MKYHAQLMTEEDRALFYLMKELESLGDFQMEQVDMLFALQRHFNCLPYITLDQLCHMDTLERLLNEGNPLTEEQQKDLARLKSLPNLFPDISDILGLTPPECREWKRLSGKR